MAGGFLPPVVMTVIADAKKFIDEQGKVVKAGDEASQKFIAAAEKNAAAAEAEAKKLSEAADKKVAAADKAAAAAEAAAAATEKAYAELAAATEEDQVKAAAAVEKATAKQEAALAKLDEAIAAQTKAQDTAAAKTEEAEARRAAATEAASQKSSAHLETMGKAAVTTGAVMGGAAVAVGLGAVDMAIHFQTSSTKLVTSAGESESAIDTVRQGMLTLAGEVGVSADQLSDAMYKVESAGYHGAAGLGLLKAAQQGAKAEGADGVKVADALSSALRDYYPHAQSAADVTAASTDVMSKFIGATSAGKMTFDDLAGSLNSILPVSSAAKISLSDTMGVLASMTVHGISAEQATQNMADAIRHLQAPTQVMSKAMATLGVDSTEVAQKLGERGLSGTMQFLSEKVKAAMPPGTEKVILDLGNALSKSSPQVQELGQKLMDGSITMHEFTQSIKEMDPISAGQAQQFATLAKSTHQIGNQMISGADVLATYGGTMAKVMGDATGLKVALMTTGENAQYTNDAIKQVSGATADASGNVKGWADVQKNAGQSMAELQATVGALGIEIGTALLPTVKAAAEGLKQFLDWANQNPAMFQAMVVGILAVSVAFGILAVAMMASGITEVGLVVAAVVVAIVALGAAIAWLVTHWSDVTQFITDVWNGFMGWIKGVINGFVTWWMSVWTPIGTFLSAVWDGIVTAFKVYIAIIYTVIVAPIVAYVNILSAIWRWLYENAIKPVWDGIVQVMGTAWNWIYGNVIKPILDYVDLVGKGFQILWNTYVTPVWNGIKDVIGTVWNWLYTNVMLGIQEELRILGDVFNWLHDNVIQPVWQGIQDTIGTVWNWLSQNVFQPIHDAIDRLGTGFNTAADIIGGAWKRIQDAASGPVRFIVDNVYRDGIEKVWNGVAGALGLDMRLPDPPAGFASGGVAGVMPGYTPGRDVYNVAVSGGEAIMRPEWTRMVGVDKVHAMNAAARTGNAVGVSQILASAGLGFADGGIAGFLGDIASKVGGFFTDPLGSIGHLIGDPVKGLLAGIGGGQWGQLLGGMANTMVGDLGTAAQNAIAAMFGKGGTAGASSSGGGSVGAGVDQWSSLVLQALSMTGQPADLLQTTLRRMNQESGGNPRAINDWDSNAAAGIPSKGLMQVIDPTFAQYAMPGFNTDIYDPLSNLLASMKYAISRYGSLAAAYNQAGGYASGGVTPVLYDQGGWLPPGRTTVQNNTGQPERVLAPGQGSGHQINVYAQTNADPYHIAHDLGFVLLGER